jgi:hypothetical protein
MQTPIQIDIQVMDSDGATHAVVSEHIAEPESWAPGSHHRTGGLYESNIHISFSNGKEMNVSRTPSPDQRHSDLAFANNDVFKKHTRRQLQDRVRDLQGQVKHHDSRSVGTNVRLRETHGILRSDDGRDMRFRRNGVLNDAYPHPQVVTPVAYANTVKLLRKHGLRP